MKSLHILSSLSAKAESLGVRKIADFLLLNPRFSLWSGSGYPNQHHYGTGGLITHVSEVVNMCLDMREKWYPEINVKVLFLSALMHDWGKLWDYEPVHQYCETYKNVRLNDIDSEVKWRSTTHKRNIHHISRSAIEWSKAVALSGECKDIEDEVTHAILSHHGQREWGSPVAPNTQMAWLLHCCDVISARMNDCEKMDYVRFRAKGKER